MCIRDRKEDVELYKKRSYRAGNAVAAITGRVSEETLNDIIKVLEEIPRGRFTVKVPEKGKRSDLREVRRDISARFVAYSWETPGLKERGIEEFNALYYLLHEGASSLLFQRIREKGFGYYVGASYDVYPSSGHFTIVVGGLSGDKGELKKELTSLLDDLGKGRIDRGYASGRKLYFKFTQMSGLRDPSTRATFHTSTFLDLGITGEEVIRKTLEFDWVRRYEDLLGDLVEAEIAPEGPS